MMTGMMDQDKRRLSALWRELGEAERRCLLRFAEFLAADAAAVAGKAAEAVPVAETPLPIPRPATESAVAGLKRLKKSYPMIEADERVLGEASRILMAKVMGASDAEVVDQLERFFAERYRLWREEREMASSVGG